MKLIATSSKNIASSNMHKIFVEECGFEQTGEVYDNNPVYQKDDFLLVQTNDSILDMEPLNDYFSPEIFIVSSTHTSESGQKTLTAHSPGNWGEAKYGGNPNQLPVAPAEFLKNVIMFFHEHPREGYTVSYEVTHHGPTVMNAPICYVEVGGTEGEWNDLDACRIVCQAILNSKVVVDDNEDENSYIIQTAVGFGGTHYAPNFSKPYVLQKIALGHICPKYAIDKITEMQFLDAFDKSYPKATIAVLDWKGLNKEQRDKILGWCEKYNISWERVSKLKEHES